MYRLICFLLVLSTFKVFAVCNASEIYTFNINQLLKKHNVHTSGQGLISAVNKNTAWNRFAHHLMKTIKMKAIVSYKVKSIKMKNLNTLEINPQVFVDGSIDKAMAQVNASYFYPELEKHYHEKTFFNFYNIMLEKFLEFNHIKFRFLKIEDQPSYQKIIFATIDGGHPINQFAYKLKKNWSHELGYDPFYLRKSGANAYHSSEESFVSISHNELMDFTALEDFSRFHEIDHAIYHLMFKNNVHSVFHGSLSGNIQAPATHDSLAKRFPIFPDENFAGSYSTHQHFTEIPNHLKDIVRSTYLLKRALIKKTGYLKSKTIEELTVGILQKFITLDILLERMRKMLKGILTDDGTFTNVKIREYEPKKLLLTAETQNSSVEIFTILNDFNWNRLDSIRAMNAKLYVDIRTDLVSSHLVKLNNAIEEISQLTINMHANFSYVRHKIDIENNLNNALPALDVFYKAMLKIKNETLRGL